MAATKRRKNNFIDNKEMYAAFVDFRKKVDAAKEAGEPRPAREDQDHATQLDRSV